MSYPELDLVLPDAAATDALGAVLARALMRSAPGAIPDTPPMDPGAGTGTGVAGAVVHLRGELGTGKTALVRSLLRTLGVGGLIRSPTYTLVETYPLEGACVVVHVDLYRISGESAVEELGLRDWMGPEVLVLVEWPERGGAAVPGADLTVMLSYAEPGRHARLVPGQGMGNQLLDKLRKDNEIRRLSI